MGEQEAAAGPANNRVAIARCAAYEAEPLYRALAESVAAAGALEAAVAGKTVLLKPNIVSDSPPEKAIVTHPVFLEAAIRLVREMGARRILVGDSPGLQGVNFTAKLSGLGEVTRRNGAEWVDFTRRKVEVPCPRGRTVTQFTLTGAVEEADVIISLPKLKTHQLMYFTGAMKNLFGLIPSVQKSPYHVRFPGRDSFASMIVDLNTAVRVRYALMDAVVGMEGPGPGSGYPRSIGVVLASPNLLALDAAACEIVGYPPREIPVSRNALARGLWLADFADIEYPLLAPRDVAVPNFEKIPLKKSGGQLAELIVPGLRKARERAAPRPVVDQKTCVRCGDCTRICASKAITLQGEGKEKRIDVDYKACIRCYCCHEICPAKAISIEKAGRNRAVVR
jgi:uncharacterized protein (DUF362 family)/Pyruvate/2-oxoacid:ferredoxin oxidoreductase delta subunit